MSSPLDEIVGAGQERVARLSRWGTLKRDHELALSRELTPDEKSCILVLRPVEGARAPAALSKLQHEFDLAERLGGDWAVRPLRLEQDRPVRLVLEDPGGDLLEAMLGRPIALPFLLELAVAAAAALRKAHAAGLVHGDIRPANLFVDRSGQVRLMGFGVAFDRRRQDPPMVTLDARAGSLAYMAPEQTGRMNRRVDARSDLYSLGVVLYRMLTGSLPFSASHPLEWVHCHLARQPRPIGRRSGAPETVSSIVLKLLAKAPEERYQTAAGLEADLRRCLTEWTERGAVEPFELGERDIPDEPLAPLRLYGREEQIGVLRESFRRVCESGAARLVLISGYSGVGKTSLAHELRPALAAAGGFFAEGKSDPQQREIPYSTIAQALETIVRQILSGSEREIGFWRDRLREALGPSAGLLVELVPHLAVIVGHAQAQPPPSLETPNRFRNALERFIRAFADSRRPLALFFDDLQWSDVASLDLLISLAGAASSRHLLIIGAYRANEAGVPLQRAVEKLRGSGAAVDEIALEPLDVQTIARLLADSLRRSQRSVQPLARLVREKTGGNPFFVLQFVEGMRDQGLIAFDARAGTWRWRLAPIRAAAVTENVADLLTARLQRLSPKVLEWLRVMACLGDAAPLATLTAACGIPEAEARAGLREAELAGLIARSADGYAFAHDRIREAAYALVAEPEVAAFRLQIGRRMLARTPIETRSAAAFELLAQLNSGLELISDPAERVAVAELNLAAGLRARRSNAYAAALTYLVTASKLLAGGRDPEPYDLVFPIELHRGECEFLTGDLAAADERLRRLADRARSLPDHAAVAGLRIALQQALDRDDLAIEIGLECLSRQGEAWSPNPSDEALATECEGLWRELGDRSPAELADLPRMSDPDQAAALDVMTALLAPALTRDANLFRLLIARLVRVSLAFGNSDGSSLGYLYLGLLLREQKGDFERALAFGRLGLTLVDRGLDRYKSRVLQGYGATCSPWAEPVAAGLPYLEQGFAAAQEAGDSTFAAFASWLIVLQHLAMGSPLERAAEAADAARAFGLAMGFGLMVTLAEGELRFIAALRATTPDLTLLGEDPADEARFAAGLSVSRHFAAGAYWHRIRKLTCLFLARRPEQAAALSENVEPPLTASLTVLEAADLHFYGALAHAACCAGDPRGRAAHLDALARHADRLGALARANPAGFGARSLLVAAETAAGHGRLPEAERLYDRAIAASQAQGLIHDEAVALEAAGRFHLRRDLRATGLSLLASARAKYRHWGATAKVRQLDEEFPGLAARVGAAEADGSAATEQLDLATLVRAAQAIASETDLDRLVETLLRLAVESGGAERGALLLLEAGELRLQAVALTEGREVLVRLRPSADEAPELPRSVINYVARTRTPLVIDDAAASEPFGRDEQVRAQGARSLLCRPLLKQTELVGVLYLEHRRVTHAFNTGAAGLLELISAQAAISIENVRLYGDLRRQESRTRRLLESDLLGIIFWRFGGKILSANAAFLKMIGYTEQDLAADRLNWREITPPEQLPRDEEMAAMVRSVGRCPAYEKDFIRKDGSRVPVLIGTMLLDEEAVDGVAFVLDQTERVAAERDREARRSAEAASQAKSEFLASMSHELRTPLNGILGYAQVLGREPNLTDKQRRGLQVIQHSGEHLLTLINDVLDISRIEAGKLELHPNLVRLSDFLRETLELVAVRAQEKGLDLTSTADPDLPDTVVCDEVRLRQVLLNLLGNAIKFTDRGSVRLEVGVRRSGRLRFCVKDSGVGVPADQLDTIFEPFGQVGDAERRLAGSGMGLAISQRIVRAMGGDIRVVSAPGKGSEFSFELDLPVGGVAPVAARAASEISGYEGRRRTVLVIDDVADNRAVLSDLLRSLGFAVIEAENGRLGLEKAQALRPDLIVTDLAMPHMDGLEVTRRLRGSSELGRIPVVAVSARTSAQEQRESEAAGVDAFLPKPINLDDLLATTARLMGLTWIRGAPAASPGPGGEDLLEPPPKAAMEELHSLALAGVMSKIVDWAATTALEAPACAAFCAHVRGLAERFESKAILAFVEKHLGRDAGR